MTIAINDNLLVEDIQKSFSTCFPNLKIEFYSKPHHRRKASSDEDCITSKAKIGDIRKKHNSGTLEIKSSDSVGKIENSFKTLFGLNVQVFRDENKDWIQTTTTDDCSLKEQAEFSEHAKVSIFPKSRKQINEYRFYL